MFDLLKKKIVTTPPAEVDVLIADGMFLVHQYIASCSTYGALARKLLTTLMKAATVRVDLVFDVFNSPSLKDVERKERGDTESLRLFSIEAKTKIGKDVSSLLKLSSFKQELLRFLSKEFDDPVYAPVIGNKLFYCAIENKCKCCW